MQYLRVKNWGEFQHYKDRNPPWIKLHRALLDDYEFARLQDASKAHLMLIWLFASTQKDGRIPADPAFLKKRLGLEKEPDLNRFIDQGLLLREQLASNDKEQLASNVLALARSRETETETEERRKNIVGLKPDAVSVLEFLNEKTGKHFEPVQANLELIVARLKEGATVDDLRAVVAKKCREWSADEKMSQYLRPATLFNRTKFAQYRGELAA